MSTDTDNLVPKVHPATRGVEAEDPMELMAQPALGDPEVMLECIVQEFVWMGWDLEELMGLFYDPQYPVLNHLREHYGEVEVRRRVREVANRLGVFRFQETVDEEIEPDQDDGPELIQLNIRGQ